MPLRRRNTRRTRRNRIQRGGGIHEMRRLFDWTFGDQWILTGSEAVRLLAEAYGIPHSLSPKDVDIIVLSKKPFRDRDVYGFVRQQSEPMRSMTFQHPSGASFDVMVEQRMGTSYVEIPTPEGPLRILSPERLLRNYHSDYRNQDAEKIAILQAIPQDLPQNRMIPQGGRRTQRQTKRGGLGRIPSPAIVDIQQDPYSARMLVDVNTAENILAARE